MTLKACCSNIFSIIKRQLWLSALWFALLFFYLPVQTALILQNIRNYTPDEYLLPVRVVERLIGIFGLQSFTLPWILMGMAFISALVYGSYMHKQKQVDFYHSQPLSRRRLLLQNTAAGLVALFVPYIINLLFTVIVTLAIGWGGLFPWGEFFSSLAVHTLYFTAIFATALIAVVISGKTAVAGITGAFLLSALPALLGLTLAAAEQFYPVFYDRLYDWGLILRWLSPAAAYVALPFSGLPHGLLPIIAYDVLALFAAILLYRRRGSEAAGQAIAFKKIQPVLKYALAILVAGLFSYVFYSIGNSDGGYFWWYFGAIAGGFLATQITEIVYAADFRAVFRNLRGLGIFLVFYLALFTCAMHDVSGFNSAVPRADQVVSAQIYLPQANIISHSDYGNYYGYGFGYRANEELKDLVRTEWDYLATGPVNSPRAITAALHIATLYANHYLPEEQQQPEVSEAQLDRWRQEGKEYLLDCYKGRSQTGYYNEYGYYNDINYTTCRIVFTLQNGRKMARDYSGVSIPVQFLLDDIAVICEQRDFVAAQLKGLMFADERYVPEQLELFETYYNQPLLDWLSAEDRDNLLSALRADMLEITVEQQLHHMPVGTLRLRLYSGPVDYPSPELWWSERGNNRPYSMQSWPIYAFYNRTLAFLADNGYGPELLQPQLEDIVSVSLVEPYRDRYAMTKYEYAPLAPAFEDNLYSYHSQSVDTIYETESDRNNITDPVRIAELVAQSYPYQTREYNYFIDIDPRWQLEVNYMGPGGQIYTLTRIFRY